MRLPLPILLVTLVVPIGCAQSHLNNPTASPCSATVQKLNSYKPGTQCLLVPGVNVYRDANRAASAKPTDVAHTNTIQTSGSCTIANPPAGSPPPAPTGAYIACSADTGFAMTPGDFGASVQPGTILYVPVQVHYTE